MGGGPRQSRHYGISRLPRGKYDINIQKYPTRSKPIDCTPSKAMSLKVPKSSNLQLFKDGYKYLEGIEDAVLRNIQAVSELSDLVRTSFGPNGEDVPLRFKANKIIRPWFYAY